MTNGLKRLQKNLVKNFNAFKKKVLYHAGAKLLWSLNFFLELLKEDAANFDYHCDHMSHAALEV